MSTARYLHPEALVDGAWLQAHLDDPNLRIFDCTFYLAYEEGTGRPYSIVSGKADYDTGHIPGSVHLDLQREFSRADSPYAFTLLSPEDTARAFERFGVGDDTRVICYSRDSMTRASRFWWMLRWLGFDNAALLDGGFDKWAADGRPVSTAPGAYPAGALTLSPRPDLFVGKDEMLAAIGDGAACSVNALEPDLHAGRNARYGRPGRIPGSVSAPASALVDAKTKQLVPPAKAAALFAAIGADPGKRVLNYCGGGIAATLDAFVQHQLGYGDIAVYDSSMSEWAKDASLPIETD
ncbi:MAG: sulfurtransferase [Alphaproteobacteria bacterium]|nr:sulfurtransferase [Alphaproteobacteria bacterium]MCB9930372.1 sulfurtransferase [Alphaproteobacteria bacterium]